MGHYDIHSDFSAVSRVRMLVVPRLLTASNVFLAAMPVCSSRAVQVRRTRMQSFDGASLRLWVMRPRDLPGTAPCLVYFHGGGFMFRASPHHFVLSREYAQRAGCVVVLVNYRLAPKHPFPTAPEDAFATYQWVRDHAEELGVDPTCLAVGGDSAGGNLAAVCAMMARDRAAMAPRLQMMLYPVIDRRMQTASMAEFEDTPVWDARCNRRMWQQYLPQIHNAPVEYASPLEAASLSGLAPAYLETAQFDCLRDEGAAYADALAAAGCAVEQYNTQGTIHGFDFFRKSEISRTCMAQRIAALRRAFAPEA